MKKLMSLFFAVCLTVIFCACQTKQAAQQVIPFKDLELGAEHTAVTAQLGSEGTSSGTEPERLTYEGLQLFEFVDAGENTKLTVFLNTEDKAYAYIYYLYDSVEQNYKDLKAYFEELYGTAAAGENGSEEWTDGDRTYSLIKMDDYVGIGVF